MLNGDFYSCRLSVKWHGKRKERWLTESMTRNFNELEWVVFSVIITNLYYVVKSDYLSSFFLSN